MAAYVVPLVFFTWRRFWKVDRAAEEQREHGWAPVNGDDLNSAPMHCMQRDMHVGRLL